MSLSTVLETPETRAFLKSRVRRPKGIVAPPVRVPPSSANPTLLGIAFDYAVRQGLSRRHAAHDSGWVAHKAVDRLRRRGERALAARASATVDQASEILRTFPDGPSLPPDQARACYLLSGLDVVFRSGRAEGIGGEPTPADLAELSALFEIVPWGVFAPRCRLMLNPTFGEGSRAVGGADADLICDDLLIDLKTTRDTSPDIDHLRQIVGYAVLANAYGIDGADAREPVTRVGLYFARAGALLAWPLDELSSASQREEILDHLLRVGDGWDPGEE